MCAAISCDCNHHSHHTVDSTLKPTVITSNDDVSTSDSEDESRYEGRSVDLRAEGTRAGKRDSALKDQQSTGRKRAARMYPLDRNGPCEWQGKANCGGGKYPILGCSGGTQQARHHGPDKSVSNNEEGNVHRICHNCHYRWHAANDPTYDWNETAKFPHRPRTQTQAETGEAVLVDLKSMAKKKARIKD